MDPSSSHALGQRKHTGILSMGLSTYQVSTSLFAQNRAKLCSVLKEVESLSSKDTVVYIEGGPSTTRFDSDHEPVFRQESYFHYLFGVREPDCAGLIHIHSGTCVLFVPNLPAEYATFMGRVPTPEDFCDRYDVDVVKYTEDVGLYLEKVVSGAEDTAKILLMKGINSDSGKSYATPTFDKAIQAIVGSIIDTEILFPILAECRVTKSKDEIDLLRYATELTSQAHVYTMKRAKPGMLEYQCEADFRHYCYYNFGARHVGYTSICGCGPNGAVLHYGHAGAPNDREIQDGDMCLFDMGAEYFCYGSDVTCSFPANGVFTPSQRTVYEGVLNAQRSVISMLQPGVSWSDCHKAAEVEIIKALVKLGIVVLLNGEKSTTIEELVDMRLGAIFMPHGLGHFIGIDTHDVGGYLPGNPMRSKARGLISLRTARVLKANMTLTVEPGCYFINHLIDEALEESSPFKQFLSEEHLNEFRGFGGVRLEDVVLITEDGCENMTVCPRTVEEVEHVKAGGKWPPLNDSALELKRKRLCWTALFTE